MPSWLVYRLIQVLKVIATILDFVLIKPLYWFLRKLGLV